MPTIEQKRLERHVKKLNGKARLGFGFCIVLVNVFAAFAVWQAAIGNVAEAVVYIEIGRVAAECLRKISRDSDRQLGELLVEGAESSSGKTKLLASDTSVSVDTSQLSEPVSQQSSQPKQA